MRLAPRWTHPRVHDDGVSPETEYRIQLDAALHAYELAKGETSPVLRFLHLALARRHTQAALSLALLESPR
jgi:hypothetical protein